MDKRGMDFPLSSNCLLFLLFGQEEIWNIWLRLDFIPLSYFSTTSLISYFTFSKSLIAPYPFIFRLYGVMYLMMIGKSEGFNLLEWKRELEEQHVRQKHLSRCRSLLELRKKNSRSEWYLSGPRIRKALVRSQLVRKGGMLAENRKG